jgi:NDP-sugar pyrophosphorylase family protein
VDQNVRSPEIILTLYNENKTNQANAYILAAGEGTRFQKSGITIPKPIAPICGTPLLEITIRNLLLTNRIKGILVNGLLRRDGAQKIFQEIQNIKRSLSSAISVSSVLELNRPNGSASSLYRARASLATRYMVIYGDVLTNLNLGWFYHTCNKIMQNDQNSMVLLAHRTDKPEECGVLEVGEQRTIDGIQVYQLLDMEEKPDKPKSNLVFSGILTTQKRIMNKGINAVHQRKIKGVELNQGMDIATHVIPELLSQNRYKIFVIEKPDDIYLRDIGTPESYCKAQDEWLELLENPAYSLTETVSSQKTLMAPTVNPLTTLHSYPAV